MGILGRGSLIFVTLKIIIDKLYIYIYIYERDGTLGRTLGLFVWCAIIVRQCTSVAGDPDWPGVL